MGTVRLTPATLLEPTQQIFAAKFCPRGKFLIGGGHDARVHCWKVGDLEFAPLEPLSGHHGWVSALGCDGDGSRLFTADSWGELKAWSLNAETPEPLWRVPEAHDGWIREVAVSPDGGTVATCGRDRAVRLWAAADGNPKSDLSPHDADVLTLAFHPDGRSVVSGDLHGKVRQSDLKTGSVAREFDAGELFMEHRLQEVGGARKLCFSAAGDLLAVAGTRPKNGGNVQGVPVILLFSWETGQITQTIELGATSDVFVTDLVFHPDGALLVTTSGNPGTGQVMMVNTDDGKPFLTEKKLANCHGLSLHPNGRHLAVTATNKGSNGNGRRLDDEGNYAGNWSPIQLFDITPADDTSS
ncbi:MAG: hypothetical protein RIK87_24000 [Fuerstiella sp.]